MSTKHDVPSAEPRGPRLWMGSHESAEGGSASSAPDDGVLGLPARMGRRGFLVGLGATGAAVGVSACIRRPAEQILPFTSGPEYVVPGVPLHFATVTTRRGEAMGLVVTSHEGRPTKVEGNPAHPVSRGATDHWAQASLLDLYDPDRSTAPARRGEGGLQDASWDAFEAEWKGVLEAQRSDGGRRLRILLQPTASPTVERLLDAVRQRFPEVGIHRWAPVHEGEVSEGARIAFGERLLPVYDLSGAPVVLSVDSDFLATEAGAVRHARQFAAGRRPERGGDPMNRLYVVESTFSVTGAQADHRLRLRPSRVGDWLRALAARLASAHGLDLGPVLGAIGKGEPPAGVPSQWVEAVAADLAERRGHALVLVGSRQPAWVHALGHAINAAIGAMGRRVRMVRPVDRGEVAPQEDIARLAADLKSGKVAALLVLGGNPAHDAPADVGFAEALSAQGLLSVHLSDRRDETSSLCSWHLPMAHELESWGDARSRDGAYTVRQPLVAPLFGGRSEIELLAGVAGMERRDGYSLVRATFAARFGGGEAAWRRAVHRGYQDEAPPPSPAAPRLGAVARAVGAARAPAVEGLEVAFVVDHSVFDGRHANNPWLLELAHPLTRIVWDNAALVSPRTAERLGLAEGDVVRLSGEAGRPVEVAVTLLPGHPDEVLTLSFGWGRQRAGRYHAGHGFDVYPLRTAGAQGFATGISLQKMGRRHDLVKVQQHDLMEGRPLALEGTLTKLQTDDPAYKGHPSLEERADFAKYEAVTPSMPPLWDEVDYGKVVKWGLSIDLSACTGCGACTVACQAENNIPVVGKVQASVKRTMEWIRIDRYFVGEDPDNPLVALQPVGCQQCEEAPCENVCPVAATAHSPEGLNDIAYNRCIGTRYCMNNCPYKVRRFNFLQWNGYLDAKVQGKNPMTEGNYGEIPEVHKMQKNPNVTVRFRGVVEKCTYCVQRIQQARITARQEGRELRGDDVTPACAQACPSQAITFGDLNAEGTAVWRAANSPRAYKLLGEVGAQPRTTYLARIRNPNPAMLGSAGTEAHG